MGLVAAYNALPITAVSTTGALFKRALAAFWLTTAAPDKDVHACTMGSVVGSRD